MVSLSLIKKEFQAVTPGVYQNTYLYIWKYSSSFSETFVHLFSFIHVGSEKIMEQGIIFQDGTGESREK